MVITDGLTPPERGKIHLLSGHANASRRWRRAVSAAGPSTGRDWDPGPAAGLMVLLVLSVTAGILAMALAQ